MNSLAGDIYLQIHHDTIEVVRRDINLQKPEAMEEAVRILKEWVQQQPHFKKKDFPLQYLERAIVMSKGSIERAKLVIDNMCRDRTLMPQYFEPHDVRENYKIFKNKIILVAIPKLTPKHYRVSIVKVVGKVGNTEGIMDSFYKYSYIGADFMKMHDYHSGVVLCCDLIDADLKDLLTNVNLLELKNYFLVLLKSYGFRLKSFHLITTSKLVHTFISFFKPYFSKKIVERVIVNQSIEELYQYYPRDIFPKEYGGNANTLVELQEKNVQILSSDEHLEHMKSMFEAKIEESVRPQCKMDYENTFGTFRNLHLD